MTQRATQASGLPTDTYAPEFQVEVEGYPLDPTTKGDVMSVKVDMDLDNADRFELTVNNWDDRRLEFKYSDTSTFDLGNRVVVKLGYAGRLVTMLHGEINSLAPRFPENGGPTLTVSGTSSMGKLKDKQPGEDAQRLFRDMADYEIAQLVAQRNGLTPVVTAEGPRHEEVWQRNQTEAAFLMERAKRIDFEFYVQTDEQTGQESLYFVKPRDTRGSEGRVFTFEYGLGLMSFTPRLSNNRQVSSVTVRGWDPGRKRPIVATADAGNLPRIGGQGRSGPEAAGKDRTGHVEDAPVQTQEEAQKLAESMLREQAYEYLTGDGQVMGLPELRPGHNVELRGLGTRYSGTYYVKTVSHSIGGSGFTTSFGVRRVFDGGVKLS
ncbi:phage late control D family protein [Pyxidicoccus xibeiensis]|uniref:phage late control D family protein n=1 Tax=Pyxidicoccus xibeiensis TaxID=2906759 RepID=UPI0020A81EEB|nr:hypothetical protein [Pyxidicoccus xibeiensis]MCP3143393.1 hypothetical protein [Pyxidicoccus xibeiensis]